MNTAPPRWTDPDLLPRGWRAAALGGLLALALALRWWAAANNDFPTVDGTQYSAIAWRMCFRGQVPYSCFPPGWPLLSAIPLRFMGSGDPLAMLRAAHIANVALGTLSVALAWLLLRPRLGFGLALAATALVALLPQAIVLAKSDLSDIAYGCGLLGGWLLLEKKRPLTAGLVLGYTYLVRPESALASVGLVAWQWRAARGVPWRLVIGHAVFVLPYLVFLKVAGGSWDVSSKTVALSQSLDAHPGLGYLGLVGSNLKLLAPLLTVPLVTNPMVVRFWLPYLPVLLLGAGLGARSLLQAVAGRWPHGGRAASLALALVMAAGLAVAARDDVMLVRRNTEAYYGLKDAGLWLRGQVTPDTKVADYKPYAPYWAGCLFVKYPEFATAREYTAWARNSGIAYLVVNVKTVQQYLPGLDALLVTPLAPELAERLELVHTCLYERIGDNTVVYRVKR